MASKYNYLSTFYMCKSQWDEEWLKWLYNKTNFPLILCGNTFESLVDMGVGSAVPDPLNPPVWRPRFGPPDFLASLHSAFPHISFDIYSPYVQTYTLY